MGKIQFLFKLLLKKVKSPRVVWALLISLLAFILRLHLAAVGPVEFDEPVYTQAAMQYSLLMRTGQWNQIPAYDYNFEHPAFNKLLYAVALLPFKPFTRSFKMWSDMPIREVLLYYRLLAMRLLSVSSGTLAVFLLSLINPFAGLALALHTFAVKYASVIYLDAFPLLAGFISLLSAERAFVRTANGDRRPQLVWLGVSAAALGMAVASKYMYGVIGIVILISLLAKPGLRRPRNLAWLVAWGLACAVFFVLFDPFLWASPLANLQKSLAFSVNYSHDIPEVTKQTYPAWQPVRWLLLSIPQQPQPIDAFYFRPGDFLVLPDTLIFILATLGLPRLIKKDFTMACWLLVGMAFLFAWATKWPQYIMLVLPPYCLSAAYGAALLKDLSARLLAQLSRSTPKGIQ